MPPAVKVWHHCIYLKEKKKRRKRRSLQSFFLSRSRGENSKVMKKKNLEMKERRDQYLFAKPVQITQAAATIQRSDLQQNEHKNGEKPMPSPEWH